jgi:hypothetical protein
VNDILGSFGFKPAFYDPFSRKVSDQTFGYRVVNMLYIRNHEVIAERVSTAPRRMVARTQL